MVPSAASQPGSQPASQPEGAYFLGIRESTASYQGKSLASVQDQNPAEPGAGKSALHTLPPRTSRQGIVGASAAGRGKNATPRLGSYHRP
jgi:hypothetical protein